MVCCVCADVFLFVWFVLLFVVVLWCFCDVVLCVAYVSCCAALCVGGETSLQQCSVLRHHVVVRIVDRAAQQVTLELEVEVN